MRKIADQVAEFSGTELFLVIDVHGSSGTPLDRNQARFHEQIKPAIFVVLQLDGGVVFVTNRTGELSTILCNRGRCVFAPSSTVENCVAYLARLMVLAISCEVSGSEFSSAPNGMTT